MDHPARTRERWPWLSLLPLGLGAWGPILAGVRARRRRWVLIGSGWSITAGAGWVLAAASGAHDQSAAGLLIIAGWAGSIATSFAIRPEYERRLADPLELATHQARSRLEARRRALALARENPALALETGIGRPDRPGAADAGLVDVNNVPVQVLQKLPGVDGALATRIVDYRARAGGFSSVEDLGVALDLDGRLVEDLRTRAVFLPRGAGR